MSGERHQCVCVARRGEGRQGLKEAMKQMTRRNSQTPRMLWPGRTWRASGPLFPSEDEESESRKPQALVQDQSLEEAGSGRAGTWDSFLISKLELCLLHPAASDFPWNPLHTSCWKWTW